MSEAKTQAERDESRRERNKERGLVQLKDWLPVDDRDLFKAWCLDRRKLAGKMLPKDSA